MDRDGMDGVERGSRVLPRVDRRLLVDLEVEGRERTSSPRRL
jgi:hypothetical protein